MNNYIVELFRWDAKNGRYDKKDDCKMLLNLQNGDFKISKIDDSQKVYLDTNIVDKNVTILSRERHNVPSMNCLTADTEPVSREPESVQSIRILKSDLTIDYEMYFNGNKFGIRFCNRSSASEKNFFDEFNKLKKKYEFVERYPSGNKKIEGVRTEKGYCGMCIEYYDRESGPIKYMGEFEDSMYDGEGEFFSEDGMIRLSCKNICSGKPNGVGRLVVGRNKIVRMIEMKDHSNLLSKDPRYTNNIYAQINPDYQNTIEMFRFDEMTVDERMIYLLKEIQKLRISGSGLKQSGMVSSLFGML
jgi:hypothetical protein